ncbi:MAG: hypothetical protein K2Y26_01630 [Gemmatimonadaceae bacterium]|nr:hypothetical protein [Gemmatimonadaceae bacterium]
MRIAISTAWVGGAGGVERAVWTMVKALRGHDVVVFAQSVIQSELLPSEADCEIRQFNTKLPWPWTVWRKLQPLREILTEPSEGYFDLYIHFRQAIPLHHVIRAKRKAIVCAGAQLGALERDFDVVMSEGVDGSRFTSGLLPVVLAPPPHIPVTREEVAAPNLPEKFFLTVFNPYAAVKGADIMIRLADSLSLPLVWCYSDLTLALPTQMAAHERIVHVPNPNQATLNHLYKRCSAYVSFSRSEGFGWAIADAIANMKPVYTRAVGVATLFLGQSGLHIYSTEKELAQLLAGSPATEARYDLSPFSEELFLNRIRGIIEDPVLSSKGS